MTTHRQRAEILQGFLKYEKDPALQIELMIDALMDAAAEAAEHAVATTREACASVAEEWDGAYNSRLPQWIAEAIRKVGKQEDFDVRKVYRTGTKGDESGEAGGAAAERR